MAAGGIVAAAGYWGLIVAAADPRQLAEPTTEMDWSATGTLSIDAANLQCGIGFLWRFVSDSQFFMPIICGCLLRLCNQLQGDDGRADRAMPGSVHRKFTDRGEDGKSVEVHSGVTGVGEEVGA